MKPASSSAGSRNSTYHPQTTNIILSHFVSTRHPQTTNQYNTVAAARLETVERVPSSCPRARTSLLSIATWQSSHSLFRYIAEADAKGGCLAIPSRMRVTGPCSMSLMLCPPVPSNCARIVINAAKGFVFTLHVAAAGGGGETQICSDGTSSSSSNNASHSPLSIDSSRSCGNSPHVKNALPVT
jgi:hypothetical protein